MSTDTRQRFFTVDQLIAGWDFEDEVTLGKPFSDYEGSWWNIQLVEPKGGWKDEHRKWIESLIEGRDTIGEVKLLAAPAADGGTVYTEDGWKLFALLSFCRKLGGMHVKLAEHGITYYPNLGIERRTRLGVMGFEVKEVSA